MALQSPQIQVLGAAREVTGSCYLATNRQSRVLVECGMIQGGGDQESRNEQAFEFDPVSIDALVLTHAHIDHSGRIPLLVKRGFQGPIFAHPATADLCQIMLRDSAFLQEKDADTENRKRRRQGQAPVAPLYTQQDAEAAFGLFQPLAYDTKTTVADGVDVRLRDAGHILGSCIVEMWLKDGARSHKVVFSGDLGQPGSLLHRPPRRIKEAQLLFMESTYGSRDHRSQADSITEFSKVIEEATQGGGNILIPAFAVGRTQELLLLLARHYQDWRLDDWAIFLDSPLAIAATRIYAANTPLLREQHLSLNAGGTGIRQLPNLEFTPDTEDSMAINRMNSGAIIIAGSGMCTGGRIRHHLKHNLWRDDCHVVIIGFQAYGTLGRRLVDGAKTVRLWGEEIRVAAKIHTIGGFSAHAGKTDLLDWLSGFEHRPAVQLIHGELESAKALAGSIQSQFGLIPNIPQLGETIPVHAVATDSDQE